MLGDADRVVPSLRSDAGHRKESTSGFMRRVVHSGDSSPAAEQPDSNRVSSRGFSPKELLTTSRPAVGWGDWTEQDNSVKQRGAMFVDAAAMKEKVRKTLAGKQAYDVTNFYKTKGFPQRIARSPWFEYSTLLVISLNAIWIAIDTDENDADLLLDAGAGFIVAENLFCLYFFGEWLLRFLSFARKLNGLRDAWFVFDSLLVTMMVMETWVMAFIVKFTSSGAGAGMGNASILRMARLLRLSRMARMVRLLRAVPELMILVKGIGAATRSVVFTLILLLFFIYIFAIFFTQLTEEDEVLAPYFHSVGQSMYTLAMHGVFLEDLIVIMDTLKNENIFLATVFFFFVMIAAMTMMNMLIGVLCEVVSAVSSTEKEALEVAFVKSKLQQVLLTSFPDKGGQDPSDLSITKAEYEMILEHPAAARLLQEVGVDVVGLVDLTDLFFEEQHEDSESDAGEKTLSFGDLMESVLELRGTNSATVKDVMNLRRFVRNAIDTRMDKIEKTLGKKPGESRTRRASDAGEPDNSIVLVGLEAPTGTTAAVSTHSAPLPLPGFPVLESPSLAPSLQGYPRALEATVPSRGASPREAGGAEAEASSKQLLQCLNARVESLEASVTSRMESLEASMKVILQRLPS